MGDSVLLCPIPPFPRDYSHFPTLRAAASPVPLSPRQYLGWQGAPKVMQTLETPGGMRWRELTLSSASLGREGWILGSGGAAEPQLAPSGMGRGAGGVLGLNSWHFPYPSPREGGNPAVPVPLAPSLEPERVWVFPEPI